VPGTVITFCNCFSTAAVKYLPRVCMTIVTFQMQILATKDKDEVAESFKDDLTLTVREGQPLVLTPSQVKNMTLDDMVSIWKVSTTSAHGTAQ